MVQDGYLPVIFAAASAATAGVTIAVASGWTAALDRRLFAFLHIRTPDRPDGRRRRLATATQDLAALGGDMLRLVMLAAAALEMVLVGRGAVAGWLIAIYGAARAALVLFKRLVRRPRPDVGQPRTTTYTTSFPSGHTFMPTVLFLSAALLIPMGSQAMLWASVALALVAGLATGTARVLLGVHWPSDVAAGWLGGIAWTSASVMLVERLSCGL